MFERADQTTLHPEIVNRLRGQAADVRRLTSGLDEAQLMRRTVPGKWSLKELVCHLWRVQQLLVDRIDAMLREDNPRFAKYAPEDDGEFEGLVERPFAETLAAFVNERGQLISRLERLPAADWDRRGSHPTFPFFDVYFTVEYLALHEAHHIFQMLERRARLSKIPR